MITKGIREGSDMRILFADNNKQVTVCGDFRRASKNSKYTFRLGGYFIYNPFKYDPKNKINSVKQIKSMFRIDEEGKVDGPVPFELMNNEFQTVSKFISDSILN